VLELGTHRRGVYDALDLPGAQPARLVQHVPEQTDTHAQTILFPGDVEQHEGEGLLRAGQRPESYAPDGAAFLLGEEAPLRAHQAGCEHAFQVLLYLFAVVRWAGGLDEEVELFCMYGTGAHLCGPPAVA
jgi:hypothetical protein